MRKNGSSIEGIEKWDAPGRRALQSDEVTPNKNWIDESSWKPVIVWIQEADPGLWKASIAGSGRPESAELGPSS